MHRLMSFLNRNKCNAIMVILAIFVLFLRVSFTSSYVLFNNEETEIVSPFEYLFKSETSDFETEKTEDTFECSSLLCKLLKQNSTQEGPLILTSYIESGETEKAKNLSAVDPSQFAGVNSHAAYFTVNKTNKWHLFFWYFPAQGVPLESTPLIIWLQGGPGCSSLAGLFNEIGPLQFKNGKVERMPITWGSNYSLLFIDQPVGTGFSFIEDPETYLTNEDMVGESLLNFLLQFLQVFKELRNAPAFIAGESYAGKYIPAFGHYIHNYNTKNSMEINLKGLAIGNGWTDPPTLLHYSEFALQLGLLDPEQAEELHKIEEAARKCWKEHDELCFSRFGEFAYTFLKHYAPINSFNYISDEEMPLEHVNFLNKPEVQDLLHAKRLQFLECSMSTYRHFKDDFYKSVKSWLEELLEHYGVMCYSGQLDMIVAYALSVHTYQSLEWSGQQSYLNANRTPVFDEAEPDKLISFIKASGNFMDIMITGAGHNAPFDQPRAAKQIIDMFIKKFK